MSRLEYSVNIGTVWLSRMYNLLVGGIVAVFVSWCLRMYVRVRVCVRACYTNLFLLRELFYSVTSTCHSLSLVEHTHTHTHTHTRVILF